VDLVDTSKSRYLALIWGVMGAGGQNGLSAACEWPLRAVRGWVGTGVQVSAARVSNRTRRRRFGDQVGEPKLGLRAGQADRTDDEANRHFSAVNACSIATRTRARPVLPRARCGGIGLPRGFGRWSSGTSPRRASSAMLAFGPAPLCGSGRTQVTVTCASVMLRSTGQPRKLERQAARRRSKHQVEKPGSREA
jgi:hypothetical protein